MNYNFYKHVIVAMLSSGLIFIILTPCVWRPKDGISDKDTRMTCPFKEMAISSSSPWPIILATINGPVLSVTLKVLMPEPPLFWRR